MESGSPLVIVLVEIEWELWAFDGLPTYKELIAVVGERYLGTKESWKAAIKNLEGGQTRCSWSPRPQSWVQITCIRKVHKCQTITLATTGNSNVGQPASAPLA